MSTELVLYVWDYNYSSWSMRAGIALRQTGAPFREINVHGEGEDLTALKALSPSGRFPILNHGTDLIWDSLAIGEYLHELYPHAGLWPGSASARAYARAVSAEMHSSFGTLREAMPMNIRAQYPGHLKTAPVRRDIARVCELWQSSLDRFGGNGPFLFGQFSLADAFFAPVVMRFTTYDVELTPPLAAYAEAVRQAPHVQDWIARAALDRRFVDAYELVR
jgi:glutathione S-transferase